MVFLRILKSIKAKDQEVRLLFLGLDNAGKTTALKYLVGEPTNQVCPTLGFNIKTIDYKGICRVNIWDIGGQKTIRGFWRNYFEETDGLVWVVDSAEQFRLDDCRKELHTVLKEERLLGAALLILFNKCDLQNALSTEQLEQILDLEPIRRTHHVCVTRCSALRGDGLLDGFEWLIDTTLQQRDLVKLHPLQQQQLPQQPLPQVPQQPVDPTFV